jgi:hypothetical protein
MSFPGKMRAGATRHFPFDANGGSFRSMSTISAVFDPHPDGSLHLPLPPELRYRRVKVEAKLEEAGEAPNPVPLATPEMLSQRREALAGLRELGGLRDVIPDLMAWQREQREERPLPGRD